MRGIEHNGEEYNARAAKFVAWLLCAVIITIFVIGWLTAALAFVTLKIYLLPVTDTQTQAQRYFNLGTYTFTRSWKWVYYELRKPQSILMCVQRITHFNKRKQWKKMQEFWVHILWKGTPALHAESDRSVRKLNKKSYKSYLGFR